MTRTRLCITPTTLYHIFKDDKGLISYIKRVEDLGFIKRIRGSTDKFEILRIIRSFIDGNWLNDMDKRLLEYQAYINASPAEGGTSDESI